MKTNISILAIAVLLLTMACNKTKSCNYAMEYNSDNKKCECINTITPDSRPELLVGEYNDCATIGRHFYYFVEKEEDYPYLSEDGDTVMLKGYINNWGDQFYYSHDPDSTFVGFFMVDDSLAAMNPRDGKSWNFWIETESSKINGIDLTRMCYIKGTVEFSYNHENHTYYFCNTPPEPTPCGSPICFIIPQEIHN